MAGITYEPFYDGSGGEVLVSLGNFSQYREGEDLKLWNESLIEGLYLMMVGVIGVALNIALLVLTFTCSSLRQWMNGFAVHGCLLDAFKSALCVPFALTLLHSTLPPFCSSLGTAYVVAQTASMFNLLAMVLAEAYTFHVHNLNEHDPDRQGAMMCVLFGITMIYAGSIIVHLGPTLIGGDFRFNQDIGNCLFAYGEIQNYIVQAMWIGIVTLTFLIIYRYIYKFYRQLKANEKFRITALARNTAHMSKGEANDESIYDVVYRLKKRVKVLLSMTIINMVCWYPLFLLTLIDHRYERPSWMYRILTIIAWSHSALAPLPLLIIDRSFGLFYQVRNAMRSYKQDQLSSPDPQRSLIRSQSRESNQTPNIFARRQMGNGPELGGSQPLSPSMATIRSVRQSYGSVRSSPHSVRSVRNDSVYDRLHAQLQDIESQNGPDEDETLLDRINQSRETDLLYDFTNEKWT